MQFWLWLHTGIKPREWVAVHRKHHRFSDKEGDPHSPKLEGLGKILLANFYFYQKEASNAETVARYTRDIPESRMERDIMSRGFVGPGLGILIAVLLLGPIIGVTAFLLQGSIYIFLNGMINGVCHVIGYRNFDNEATNLRWVAWLTAGEGFHNNHHHSPSRAKLSVRGSEFDPAWVVIRLLRVARLAEW
jgi:stearoyl-CoA desaturase (delta-9 desaturase)